jgi:hypothetical protein
MAKRYCERCRAEIPAERVEAVPDTALCVKCSEAVGGEFEMIAIHERTSKAGSLKKNYGGVNIQKRRRKLPPKQGA